MMKKKYIVIKGNGEEEIFNEKKFRISLDRSGASNEVIEEVVNEVEKIMFDGITTRVIFKKAFSVLKNKQHRASLRYNLANAVAEMGPSGFAFEKFIGEIFREYKYSPVYVGKMVPGKCIKHEMDVIAFKDNEHVTAELKFHNSKKAKSDLKVILYMQSRFNDILEAGYYKDKTPRQVIITNTKFTSNAKKYAKCSEIEVLSWNYPFKDNLHDFILKSGVHPITAITSINKKAINYFLNKKIVSCKALLKNSSQALKDNHFIPREKISKIEEEIKTICVAHT